MHHSEHAISRAAKGILLIKIRAILAKSSHVAHTARGERVGLGADGLSQCQLPLLVAAPSQLTSLRFLQLFRESCLLGVEPKKSFRQTKNEKAAKKKKWCFKEIIIAIPVTEVVKVLKSGKQ